MLFISDDGLVKCSNVTFMKGRITEIYSIPIDFVTEIRKLEEEACEYMKVIEGDGIVYIQRRRKENNPKDVCVWC